MISVLLYQADNTANLQEWLIITATNLCCCAVVAAEC